MLTHEAAERIGRAVLEVERGDRSIAAPAGQRQVGDDALVRGTFTAPWNKGATATVTDATLSAVTYQAVNYFANIVGGGTRKCCLGYVAGEWILIAAEC